MKSITKVLPVKEIEEINDTFKTSYRTQFKNSPKNRKDSPKGLFQSVKPQEDLMQLLPQSNPMQESDPKVIMWGGRLHLRQDFNKKRDAITEWNES